MKTWLTLILGTISITGGMTYLVMHQGAQSLTDATSDDLSTPSKAEFSGGPIEGNLLSIAGGDSRVGKESIVTIPIKCAADTPLRLELLRVSCACVNGLYLAGQKIEENQPVTIKPGETATLKISWTPKPEMSGNPAYRFSINFFVNDPQYSPTFRIELTTRVQPKEEPK